MIIYIRHPGIWLKFLKLQRKGTLQHQMFQRSTSSFAFHSTTSHPLELYFVRGLNEPCCDWELNVSSFQPETFTTRMWPRDVGRINMEAEGGGRRWGVKDRGMLLGWMTEWHQPKEKRKETRVKFFARLTFERETLMFGTIFNLIGFI